MSTSTVSVQRTGTFRRFLGVKLHAFSDLLHLTAHRIIGDPDWRARNGEPYVVVAEATGEQFIYDRHTPKGETR